VRQIAELRANGDSAGGYRPAQNSPSERQPATKSDSVIALGARVVTVLTVTSDLAQHSVLVLPLRLDSAQRVEVERRFDAAFRVYRACVQHGAKRMDVLRESKAWRRAAAAAASPERTAELRRLAKEYGVDEFEMLKRAYQVRNGAPQLRNHLVSVDAGELGRRAYRSIAEHMYGNRGRPHIPRSHESQCIDGASGLRGLTIKGNYAAGPHPKGHTVQRQRRADCKDASPVPLYLQWGDNRSSVKQLVVPVHATHRGAGAARHAYYLGDLGSAFACRLVRQWIKGRWRYELHIRFNKPPYRAPRTTVDALVSIDLGPQRLAAVSDGDDPQAVLITPSPADRDREQAARRKLRRQQRAQERSRRAANPQAYTGKARRRGVRAPRRSKAYKTRQNEIRETFRRHTAEQQRRERQIARHLVATAGRHVVTEDVARKPWAKLWGSSLLRFAPARFLNTIEREARIAGGTVRRVSVWTSAMSSTCICGSRVRKPLEQRRHTCERCGLGLTELIDRDLFSAFLGLYLEPERDVVDTTRACVAWAGAQGLLAAAVSHPVAKATAVPNVPGPGSQPGRRGASSSKPQRRPHPGDVVARARAGEDSGTWRAVATAESELAVA
jgi:putative transposase